MKKLIKFIVLVFVTLIHIGCAHQNSNCCEFEQKHCSAKNNSIYIIEDKIPYHRHIVDRNRRNMSVYSCDGYILAYKFKYQGHAYIMFSENKFENGVVHDPDCECFNKH